MSKFACKCGEIIRDQTDDLPYKGHLIPDAQYFNLIDSISADISSFIEARIKGQEAKWITTYFSESYPCSKDHEVLHDIIASHLTTNDMDVYQCSKCGRIHVEHRDDSSKLESFKPDETPPRDIFKEQLETIRNTTK